MEVNKDLHFYRKSKVISWLVGSSELFSSLRDFSLQQTNKNDKSQLFSIVYSQHSRVERLITLNSPLNMHWSHFSVEVKNCCVKIWMRIPREVCSEKQKCGGCCKKVEEVIQGLLQSPLGAKEMFEMEQSEWKWNKCCVEVLDVFVEVVGVGPSKHINLSHIITIAIFSWLHFSCTWVLFWSTTA